MANPTGQVPVAQRSFDDDAIDWPIPPTADTYQVGEMLGVRASDGFATHFDDTQPLIFIGFNSSSPRKIVTSDYPVADLKLSARKPRSFTMPLASGTASRLTDIGKPVYAADSGHVQMAPTAFNNLVGYIEDVMVLHVRDVTGPAVWIVPASPNAYRGGVGVTPTAITANGAIDPNEAGSYVVTKAGVALLTLAAPTAGVDDGKTISVVSATAFAHTITATGLFLSGSANVNVATFAAFAGAGVQLVAYQGKWIVQSSTGVTFT